MPASASSRLDAPKFMRPVVPYARPAAPGASACAVFAPSEPPDVIKATLPLELVHLILAQGAPWSPRDVRAISQSCRQLNHAIGAAQPQIYRRAHHGSLYRALKSGAFLFQNPRAQSVLGTFAALHLLDHSGPDGKRRMCDPSRTPVCRLAQVMDATRHARVIRMGEATCTTAPWMRLLEAGLQAEVLTGLDFKAATLSGHDLAQLCNTFTRMRSLQHLVLPSHVDVDTFRYFGQASFGPQAVRSLCFAPLKSLRKFIWKTSTHQAKTYVDLSQNWHLRHLELDIGDGHGLAIEDWQSNVAPNRMGLKLPPSALHILHLRDIILTPGTAHPLNHAPWQHSLIELRLAFQSECHVAHVDLSTHTALRRLSIEFYGRNEAAVLLPDAPHLKTLHLWGDATANLLAQLRTPGAASLQTLLLSCKVDQDLQSPNSIPWPRLVHLKNLICFSWDNHPDKMQLSRLNIPGNNKLIRLRLSHTVFGSLSWQPEDAALKRLFMPHLRTLDLSGIHTWSDEPVATILHSFDEAFDQRDKWPSLQELVGADTGYPSQLQGGLERLAARHGLRFSLAPPEARPSLSSF